MNKNNFFQELKRRNVYKVAIAYGIAAWLLAQVASLCAAAFEAPTWVMKMILVCLIIGFPIALILAWAYEMTSQGIVRTDILDSEKVKKEERKTTRPLVNNIVIGVLLLLLIGQFIYNRSIAQYGQNPTASNHQELSIAVLPLINLNSKDEDLDYFSKGVSQEIVDELAHINSFEVTAFTQSSFYASQSLAPIEIANKLGVKYLMAGTVRLLNNAKSVKLSIELFDPAENEISWKGSFDESIDDITLIQNSIAKQVSEILNINLNADEIASIDELETTNGDAFKLYLRAKYEVNKFTEEGYKNTHQYLKEAIHLDPNFSNAHILYAWSLIPATLSYWAPDLPASQHIKKQAFPLLSKALELSPNSSDAFLVRGGLRLFYENDIRGAKKDVDHAISLNSWPRVPTDYCVCTAVSTYVALEDVSRAKELAKLAHKIDPGNILLEWDMANIHMISGEFEEAANQYNIIYQKSQIPSFAMFVGLANFHAKNYNVALEYFNYVSDGENKVSGFVEAYLSSIFWKEGNKTLSDTHKQNVLKRLANGEHHLNWPMAIIHLSRNEIDIALDYLEESFAKDENTLAFFTSLDPIFDILNDHPRFIELRKQMNYYN